MEEKTNLDNFYDDEPAKDNAEENASTYNPNNLEYKSKIYERSQFLSKMMFILFILFIPNLVSSTLTKFEVAPIISLVGSILGLGVSVVTIVVFVLMSKYEKSYLYSLIALAANVVFGALGAFVPAMKGSIGLLILISLLDSAAAILTAYFEFKGHELVTATVDPYLAEKWSKLFKWDVICVASVFVGTIFVATLILAILGLIVVVGAAIGAVVLGILKIIYLYESSQALKLFTVK